MAGRPTRYAGALEHEGKLLIIYSKHRDDIVIRTTPVSFFEGSKP